MAAKKTFEEWIKEVDREITRQVGMDTSDLSDCPYQDWYADGMTPKRAATKAIKREMGEE